MKYTGYDKTATAKMAGTEKFVELCARRWSFTNLGTLVVRQMRSGQGMSVHSTARGADIGFPDTKEGRAAAVQAMLWFVKYYKELGIEEVHDYGGLRGRAGDAIEMESQVGRSGQIPITVVQKTDAGFMWNLPRNPMGATLRTV